MKTVFTELPTEDFYYDTYYNENDAITDNIYVGGNRDYISFNEDLRDDVVSALVDIRDEVLWRHGTKTEIINNYLKKDKNYSTREIGKLWKLAEDFAIATHEKENDIICEVLSIIHGEEFAWCNLRGCSQGEWLECIYPKKYEESTKYIEAVLFGMGTEYADEDGCTYFVYESNHKKSLAEQSGADEKDIVLRKIVGKHTVYEYEEI